MARNRTSPGDAPAPERPGASLATQPVRVASGQPYGQRQALESQQQSAPLPVAPQGGPPPAQPGPAAGAAGALMPDMSGLFGPTQMPGPGGPLPQGGGNQFVASDPDMLLKAIYEAYPHPEIARLMRAVR